MAASLAEYLLMHYFFPDAKDRKKQQQLKSLFLLDMQFNLSTGKVARSTDKLRSRKYLVSSYTSIQILLGYDSQNLRLGKGSKVPLQ
jgi:hypothetical protein